MPHTRSEVSLSPQTSTRLAFDQLMEKNLATALVDRLLHHAHVVLTEKGIGATCRGHLGQGGGAFGELTQQRQGP